MYHYLLWRPDNTSGIFLEIARFGYLGVPLFFMISGYVISLSAQNRNPIEFAISRFTRLYPTAWVCILITSVTVVCLTGRHISLFQIAANATLLNEYLGVQDIDGVYWTLKAELKFYACVFLLLTFGVFNQFKIWLSLWLGLVISHHFFHQPFFLGWFITPEYSCYFIAGVALFLISTEKCNVFNLSILAISLIVSSLKSFSMASGFIVDASFNQRIISVALIWLFYVIFFLLATEKLNIKGSKLTYILGGLTYPLYLLHNVAGKTFMSLFEDQLNPYVLIGITICGVLLISWATNELVENRLAKPIKFFLIKKLKRVS